MVDVPASNVALPEGARATPSDFRAPAVPASMATEVPTPVRLGMAVTVSAAWAACLVVEFVVDDELFLLLPQAAPVRARTPTSAVRPSLLFVCMKALFRLRPRSHPPASLATGLRIRPGRRMTRPPALPGNGSVWDGD